MNLLGKYIILYFEIELDNKKSLSRRLLNKDGVKWEFFENSKKVWSPCNESFRDELKPSVLEGNYKNYMRTQKLERILIDE